MRERMNRRGGKGHALNFHFSIISFMTTRFLLTLYFILLGSLFQLYGQNHISNFESVSPNLKGEGFIIPNTHTFQVLFREGDNYFNSEQIVPGNNDFTGYVPIEGSNEKGYLSVNHEIALGNVSIANIAFDRSTNLWIVEDLQPLIINAADVNATSANCSGTVTDWNTVISCEETTVAIDVNDDGYIDLGWCFELDPATRQILDYGTGKQQKLWALGNMKHENVVIHPDHKTVYFGEDGNTSCIYKFVADEAQNLTKGTLYTLMLDDNLVAGEPQGSTGTWIQVPNEKQEDLNDTYNIAAELGGTYFNYVEDVEIHPTTNQIYFASKRNDRVYRFTDDGETISDFETYVGGTSYSFKVGSFTVEEEWGVGNDNLAFDNQGNLWVFQDGSKDFIWVVNHDHTPEDPNVRIFATLPNGSEPTGITFSPDNRFMFMSIQHPHDDNEEMQEDASGEMVLFNKATTVVVALKEHLGPEAFAVGSPEILFEQSPQIQPNPISDYLQVSFNLNYSQQLSISLHDVTGKQVSLLSQQVYNPGNQQLNLSVNEVPDGIYFLQMQSEKGIWTEKIVIQK